MGPEPPSGATEPDAGIVGMLPLLLYQGEAPPKVALVGYGSGVTAGAITVGRGTTGTVTMK